MARLCQGYLLSRHLCLHQHDTDSLRHKLGPFTMERWFGSGQAMKSQAYFLTLEASAEQRSQDILSNAGGSAVTALSRHSQGEKGRLGSAEYSPDILCTKCFAHVKHTERSQHFCLCSPHFLMWKLGIQSLFRTSGLEPYILALTLNLG